MLAWTATPSPVDCALDLRQHFYLAHTLFLEQGTVKLTKDVTLKLEDVHIHAV